MGAQDSDTSTLISLSTENSLDTRLTTLICSLLLTTGVAAQTSSPQRYISPLNCVNQGRVGKINVVEMGETKFKVSQKGHDDYNHFRISKTTKISEVQVGSFIFESLPTRDGGDNGAYSKKLHFDIYDYGNLNGKKATELIRIGDTIYSTFLVKFATPAPMPLAGSKFDKQDSKYHRNLFFQFWPGGVATHLYNYPRDTPEANAGKFGYVTVLTADYGENRFVLSDRFEVEQNTWYRMYFQYHPDLSDGRILVKMARHRKELATKDMRTILDLSGATFYQDRPKARMLPTFGNYHWGACPKKVETHFTEILVSRKPIEHHSLRAAQQDN